VTGRIADFAHPFEARFETAARFVADVAWPDRGLSPWRVANPQDDRKLEVFI